MTTTWNPADKDPAIVLSGSNLIATQSGASGAWRSVRATTSHTTGKWYFELTVTAYDAGNGIICGLGNSSAALNSYVGSDANGSGYQANGPLYGFDSTTNGCIYNGGVGEIIGLAVDFDTGKTWLTDDGGNWNEGFGNPVAGTGANVLGLSVNDGIGVFPIFSGDFNGSPDGVSLNAGEVAFTYSVPAGFSRWSAFVPIDVLYFDGADQIPPPPAPRSLRRAVATMPTEPGFSLLAPVASGSRHVRFDFHDGTQGFAANPGASVFMAWQSGDSGYLESSRTVTGNSGADSSWTRTLTYIDMGVPAGAIVRSITQPFMESKCTTFTSAGAGNTAGAVTLQDGATVATLATQRAIAGTDSVWVQTNGVDLTGLNKAASNSVVITIPNHLQNTSTPGSSLTLRQDTLDFILTFDFPHFDSIDQRPQPPARRQSIDRAAGMMVGDPGIAAAQPIPVFQVGEGRLQPPSRSDRIRRNGAIMAFEPGNEAKFVFVAPTAPIRFALDQPTQLPRPKPGHGYSPTRLPLGLPIFSGSVSWETAEPDLLRRRPAFGYRPTRLSLSSPTPSAGSPLVEWVPPLPAETVRRRPVYGDSPLGWPLAATTGTAAPLTRMWGEPSPPQRRGRVNYEGIGQKLAVPLFPIFVPLTWERDHNFTKTRSRRDVAVHPAQVPYPPLVPTQAGVKVGFESILATPRLRPANRGAALRDVAINQYPAAWVNSGFEPALPLALRPNRRPSEPTQYGPLGGRVTDAWGFQQVETWPPVALPRRHAYAELPRLDTAQLNLTAPLAGWEAISGVLAARARVYRSAALHRDFNIEGSFRGSRPAGWEVAPPILPHPRYKISDYAYPGNLRVPGVISHEWGFEQTQAAPVLNPLGRHRHTEPVWRVDPLPLVPAQTLAPSGWEPVLLPPKITGVAARGAGFQQEFRVDGAFFPTVAFAWQPQLPTLLFRHHTSQASGGDATAELFPPTLHAWGFEPQYATPVRSIWFRSRHAEVAWRQIDPISTFPMISKAWGFEAVPANPLRNFWNRRAALAGAANIETRFERGFPLGWPVQPWQPPKQNRYRQAALFTGEPGIAARFNRFFPVGWQVQDQQPPATRQKRAAAALPAWVGDVAKYVPQAPAPLISWVPNNEIQKLRSRSGGLRHLLLIRGDSSGLVTPSPSSGVPRSGGFIANMGRGMNRGVAGVIIPIPGLSALLLEDGSFLLLEDGDEILLE